MSRVPFLKWYPSDYLGDTMHLTTLEHGAYTLLLWHYWLSGPLPDDDRVLARIAKVSPTIFSRKFSSTIRTFFVKESDGKLHQKRMDKDREKLEEKIEKTRAAASTILGKSVTRDPSCCCERDRKRRCKRICG